MTLPTRLVPVLVFVSTVGISVPVTLGAHLFHRNSNSSFGSALRVALLEAGGLYVVGVAVVWSIAGGIEVWEIAITLLVTGFVALTVLSVLPLTVGQRLIRRVRAVDDETALRFATYGWPVAMLAVFGTFVAPGGLTHGDLFSLGGEQVCLAGFCGIVVPFAAAVLLELVLALLGPGIVGLVVHSSAMTVRGQTASS